MPHWQVRRSSTAWGRSHGGAERIRSLKVTLVQEALLERMQMTGLTLLVKEGEIESVGNHDIAEMTTKFAVLTFSDGERARSVTVDAAMDQYVAPGASGRFAFLEKRDQLILVAVETNGGGLRVADDVLWRKIVGMMTPQATLFTVMGLCLSAFGIGIPILAFGLCRHWCLSAHLARVIGAIRAVERAGSTMPVGAPL